MPKESIAKITRPRLADILPRTRLFRLLDQTRKKSPVIWISGPAGSGKTTLVSSYIDFHKLPCLWYQVDKGDADIAAFFYYLGLAVQKARPRSARALPLLTPEYQFGIPVFAKRYFEELFSRLRPPAAIVFDNFQDAGEQAGLDAILQSGLAAVPDGVFVIIVSRRDPPPALSILRAKGLVEIVGWNELRLDEDEARGMLKLRGRSGLPDEAVRRIITLTEGWAAGLVLMTERVHNASDAPASATREVVFQYFAEEIFQRVDQSVRDFLLKTAFLPKISAAAAQQLTGLARSDEILDGLVRRNFFTVRRAGSAPIYEYHPLFREFLTAHAVHAYEADDLRLIRQNAAAFLVETGHVDDAARLYIESSEWQLLAALALAHARALIIQGRARTLDEWLSHIPEQSKDGTPWLLYWQGASKMTADLNESRKYFERAYRIFKTTGDAAGLYLAWAGIVDTYVFAWSDFKPLDQWIDEIEWLLKTYPAFPATEIEARAAAGIFCALMYRRPDHPDMERWEERALSIALSAHDPYLQLIISSHLILYYSWWNGRQSKAELLVRTLHHTAKSFESSPFTTIVWKSIEGAYLWMACHFEESVASLEQAIATAERTGIHLWDAMLYANMIYCHLTQGKYEQAACYLEKMSFVVHTPRTVDSSHYHFLRAFESLALSNLPLAIQHIQAGMKLSSEAGVPYVYNFYITSLADILVEQGVFDEAKPYLEEARTFGRAMKSYCLEYQYCWITALIAYGSNDRATGQEYLRQYLRISRECRTVNHAWWRSSAMIRLLTEALTAGIEVAHVQELIRLHGLVPPQAHLHLENWPWPVRVFTLGRFVLEVGGKAVLFTGKTPKKPLELLKAVIARGGSDVSEDQVVDELWPEASGDLAYKSFEMALQRLRKLLGSDRTIRRQEGKLSLDPYTCWTDVRAFEQIAVAAEQEGQQGRTAREAGKRTGQSAYRPPLPDKMASFEKAIGLYQGRFLPADQREPWLTLTRERLRSKFLRIVAKAGELYEQAGEWKQAIDCFERGLERDGVCEEFYQHLMICHNKLGHRSEAVKTYERCRAALFDGLGLEPSAKTEDIISSIRGTL